MTISDKVSLTCAIVTLVATIIIGREPVSCMF